MNLERHASGCAILFISLLLSFLFVPEGHTEPVTVLVPNRTGVEKFPEASAPGENAGRITRGTSASSSQIPEVDMLMTMMHPYAQSGLDMDMPQVFAAIVYPPGAGKDEVKPERTDLLGFVEEIRYRDKKAWGANMILEKPGLYQFIMEARPWWDEKNDVYRGQLVKVMLPAASIDGWEQAVGQPLEIVPLTRPFGLVAPALFSGCVISDTKPLPNAIVRMGRINSPKIEIPDNLQRTLEARSDALGQFSFILTQPGWWYCEAQGSGEPLKGPDGELKPVVRSALLWLYVDGPQNEKGRR